MYRCINHIFGYCKDPSLIHSQVIVEKVKDLGGRSVDVDCAVLDCPLDWHTCRRFSAGAYSTQEVAPDSR